MKVGRTNLRKSRYMLASERSCLNKRCNLQSCQEFCVELPLSRSVPVAVVCACLHTKQFLFSRLISEVAASLVAVFFGLEERGQVDARPHFLAGELAVWRSRVVSESFEI